MGSLDAAEAEADAANAEVYSRQADLSQVGVQR